jgi:cell division protein FtsB
MTNMALKEKIFLLLAILLMFSTFLFILFGDNGMMDLNRLRSERDLLIKKNDELNQQNLILHRKIERLKNDPEYIESVVRKDYGMIKNDEVVIKIKNVGNMP